MNGRDFALMYPEWRRMTVQERVARMIAFRAWDPPPGTPLEACAALTKRYTDGHWMEYLQTAAAVIQEVEGGASGVG